MEKLKKLFQVLLFLEMHGELWIDGLREILYSNMRTENKLGPAEHMLQKKQSLLH